MSQSLNIQQPSDLHWTSENWEQQSAGGAVVGVEPRHYYQGHRSEWDWDNQMLLAQNPGNTDDGERKMQILPGFMRPYNGVIQSNFSANGFPQQNQVGIYGGPTGFQGFAGHGMVENTQSIQQSPSPLHAALPFASMAAGVVPANGYGDLRSFEQRRRLFGLLEMDPRSLCDAVKREDLYADAHARIGLNLGVRTYFSTEDTLARLGKRPRANSPGAQVPLCQAEGCKADLSAAKHYHRRHKVCELHSKAATVIANGQTQRFCQQCSRFHPLTEFDEGKRSCRKRLADHNRRRRKPQPNASAAASESTAKEDETDGTQDNGTADDKLASSPTTSLENSDSKTGSGDSLQLRTSCTSTKTEGNSGAHSTLLGDQPTEPDTQALLSALSPPVSLMQNSKQTEESTYEQLLHGANLSLSSTGSGQSSVGNHPVSWLKPLELNTDSTSNQLINFQDKSGQSTPMGTSVGSSSSPQVLSPSVQKLLPLQSSRDIAGSDWILSSMTKQSRSDQAEQYDSTFQAALDGHQILGLLENPLTAQQSRTQPMEFLQEQSSFNNGSDQDPQSRQPSRLKLSELQPFGSSMFQSM